ncbi:ABC transporter ATP-binding protein [Mesorhizobium xinjiangense]|uniref:ABC transporter ATP-binding protein n=1 Tax=Mesorhizobium xinjiangense TaxID=2678685 RepID=UPI001F2686B1|nr:ABC transporter ATP-binding protein [Mesorhizobium xinjiangense]
MPHTADPVRERQMETSAAVREGRAEPGRGGIALRLEGISKVYGAGQRRVTALDNLTLSIGAGQLTAIMGSSGSGKTTLLNIMGLLDAASAGSYHMGGRETARLSSDEMAILRKRSIGFVFQSFNLLPRLTALDNAALPLIYHGLPRRRRRERAARLLQHVGLADHLGHTPAQLSGGQCQRVAIARALIARPALLLADEPTGALDSLTASEILRQFSRVNDEFGVTVVIITHDPLVADHCRRRVTVRDGAILADGATP